MKLQGGFGDIDSGIGNGIFGFHSFDRVLTHSYIYELTAVAAALATVRVWTTGRARLWLGYGLAKGRPRVARARARRRAPFAQGRWPHFLAWARKARNRNDCTNQVRTRVERRSRFGNHHRPGRCLRRCSTPARCARLRGAAPQAALQGSRGAKDWPKQNLTPGNHKDEHIRVASPRATLG